MALPDYGMDKELKQKQEAKYDVGLETTVTEWIEAVTGEKKGNATFAEWLKSGEVLCAVVNAIRPGTVKKVNTSKMPFKQMENITYFMKAARELGVPESAMFGTPDLYEEKNVFSVVSCIYTLGGAIQVNCPEFDGPALGVALNVESRDKKRDLGAATQSGGFAKSMEVAKPTDRVDYCVRNIGGAPQAHPGDKPKAANEKGEERKSLVAAPPPPLETPSLTRDDCIPGSTSQEYNYGMDKELKEKQEAKYDGDLEREVVEWIEAITGESKKDESLAEWLKNGHVLCALANAIRPGMVKKVNSSNLAFKQMENITFFMNAARELGVPESAMFGTPDLYEAKNLGSVVNCIYTLGGAIQISCPDFKGPRLGIALNHESGKDKKRASGILTDQAAGFSKSMDVQRPTERADYVVKPIDRVVKAPLENA